MVIYTAAGTLPILKCLFTRQPFTMPKALYTRLPCIQYKIVIFHGGRLPCQKSYIHGCRASSIQLLFTRQPFTMPKELYTRLPCIQYKIVIYTAAVFHDKKFIYTAAVHPVKSIVYTAAFFHAKRFIYSAAVPPVLNG